MDMMARAASNPAATNNNGLNLKRNSRCKWSEEETVQLLEAWSQRDVQALLGNGPIIGPHKRHEAFERVAFHLAQHQMDKNSLQCRDKMKALQLVYKSLTTGQGKVPKTISDRIVQKLLSVMGRLPAPTSHQNALNNIGAAGLPQNFSSHFQASTPIGPPSAVTIMTNRSSSAFEDLSSSEDDVEMEPARPGIAPIMTSTPSRRTNRGTGVRVPVGKKSSRRNKKSGPSQKNNNAAVYVLIDKLIATQAASNERFAALEERRILMEKELEQMRLEAEARNKEAQRQHELQLSSTMAQHISYALKILDPGAILRIGDPSKSHYVEVVNGCGPCGEFNSDINAVYSTIY